MNNFSGHKLNENISYLFSMRASSLARQLSLSTLGRALTQGTNEGVNFFLETYSLSLIITISSENVFQRQSLSISSYGQQYLKMELRRQLCGEMSVPWWLFELLFTTLTVKQLTAIHTEP